MAELTAQQVDCILYNLRTWRRLVSLIEPRTSTSVVRLEAASTSRSTSSGVERAAMLRTEVSQVLDRVIETWRNLSRHQQTLLKRRYHDRMSYREIANVMTRTRRRTTRARHRNERVSTATVHREVEALRIHFASNLGGVSREFWRAIETLEGANAKQTC